MVKGQMKTHKYIFLLFTLTLLGCTNEAYDTGDGAYSYMRADLVDAHTDGNVQIDYIDTDEGERLSAYNTYTISWTKTGNTTYRTLLYYNKIATGQNSYSAQILSSQWVPVLAPDTLKANETAATDPITFTSAWLSANKKYINIGFSIKTGKADDSEAVQTIGLVYNGTTTTDDGRKCDELLLVHDQGNVPEYYSTRYYASIRTADIDADIVRIKLNSYDGEVVKEFSIR